MRRTAKAKMAQNSQKNQSKRLNWLVSIVGAVIIVVVVVFFGVVATSAQSISDEVDTVREGPFPVSVAAGHMETDLIRLQTVIEHMTATQLGADPEFESASENTFASINNDMKHQLEIVDNSVLITPEKYAKFRREYQLLSSRMSEFSKMCWGGDGLTHSYEEIVSYANDYLYPVLNELLELNTGAIDQTNAAIENLHDSVNDAVEKMTLVSLIMLVAVVLTTVLYQYLLRRRTKHEEQLRLSMEEAVHKAAEASQAKSAFLSNMSHDIRTPMNAIVGLTTIADENIDDKLRVKQCLNRIATSSQHLLSLINDVLDMNKIESGKVSLNMDDFSITDLVEGIEMIMQSQPGSKRLNKTIEIRDLRHDLVVGDTLRLRQVLLNLTSNALKYSNEGDSVSLIVTETDDARPGFASFTFVVSDTGIGMKREFLEHIFEPFEREKNDFTIFTEGTGLGMAITKNLVDLMSGNIQIESELGLGTTVTIALEFKVAPPESVERHNKRKAAIAEDEARLAADAGEAAALEEAASGGSVEGGSEKGAIGASGSAANGASPSSGDERKRPKKLHVSGRVLVAEDNEINMEIAKQLIESRGAAVDEAIDGFDAMTKVTNADENTYDLVFMDMQMPHMSGVESTKAIRIYETEHGRSPVPIVAMTANAFDSDRDKALEAGMDDFVTKPIDVRRLEEMLGRYLEED